jgi:hypothetical protein
MEEVMGNGSRGLVLLSLLLACLLAASTGAYAQGAATSTLTGTVTDSTGAIVPGADVTAKNNATATVYTAVSGSNGTFTIPAVTPGTYTVTVALMGFKTAILNDVILSAGVPASVKAVLDLGKVEETVIVEAATQLVQTQSAAVASTINVKQITSLPLPGRGAFDFVNQLPGVALTGGSTRGATVNGLPQSAVNITLDGMNIQDNFAKSWDGMFTRVSPRLDAVEEVSMGSAAGNSADVGQGGVQVRFVTRSGTNQFRGSGYYYLQDDKFNTNTWFNTHRNVDANGVATAKPAQHNDQPGFRIGGPIVKDKAFFFVNYEWISSPSTLTLRPTVMSSLSEQGIFQYAGGAPVNLLQLAASKGYTSTMDPLTQKTIAAMRSSMSGKTLNATTDPLTQEMVWQLPTAGTTKYPTVRIDVNASSRHRVTFSTTYNHLISNPDTTNSYYTQYPGFPNIGTQDSVRYTWQGSVRSTVSANLVNEFRVGGTGGATKFFPENDPSMFADQGGYALGLTAFKGIANPYSTAANSSREGSTRVIEDNLTWLRGKHSFSFGGSYTQARVWLKNQQFVPTIGFGIATGDPADAMFTTANFPGASTTDLTNARNLYSVLTGRVSSIGRNARVATDGSTYVILGESLQEGRMPEYNFYAQDSWRVKPSLTVNAGLRYALQMPFYAVNNSYSNADINAIMGVTGAQGLVVGSTETGLGNLFQPGVLQGTTPTLTMLTADTNAYHVDANNVAPSVGVAWTVGSDKGFLHKLLGSPGDSVVRGGFTVAYQRPGTNDFTQVFGGNPGVSIDATRNQTNGNLGAPPILLSSSDLSAPPINLTRTYPMSIPSAGTSIVAFDQDIQVTRTQSATIGMQRALGKTMMVEARYIHTNSYGEWTGVTSGYFNYNELNVNSNGFAKEFRAAQANLQANIAAGKGNTFAYSAAVPGTVPLPIFLANLNKSTDTPYSGSGWTNTTLVSYLYPLNPNVLSAASNLRGNATYVANAKANGLPVNFFVANPDVNNANVMTNGMDRSYNGIQLVFTRRFAQGLQANANYTYGRGDQSVFYSLQRPYQWVEQNYSNSGSGNATGNVRHIFVTNAVYELPFGQGKPFGGNVGQWKQRLIGNWTVSTVVRVQSGRMVDFGNVNMVGFTKEDLQGFYATRKVTDPANPYRTLVYMLPQDVIDNTIKAYSFNATGYSAGAPTGKYFMPASGPNCLETASNSYGDCGQRSVIVQGPKVVRVDFSLIKEVQIVKRAVFRFEWMVFNLFNNVNYNPVSYVGSVSDSYQTTGAIDQSRTMQLAFRVTW